MATNHRLEPLEWAPGALYIAGLSDPSRAPREVTPDDLSSSLVLALELNDEKVLWRLCRLLEVSLIIERAATPMRYILGFKASPDFSGTLEEAAMLMRGYALAWCEGRQQRRLMIDQAIRHLQEQRR